MGCWGNRGVSSLEKGGFRLTRRCQEFRQESRRTKKLYDRTDEQLAFYEIYKISA
jgi:hypothetical protein